MELKIEHLSKQFKDKTAVNDINLQRRAGLSTAARMAPFILTVDWLGWLCYSLIIGFPSLSIKGQIPPPVPNFATR